MTTKDDLESIKGIKISRLPKKVREEFIDFAREEYADDFGMALTEIWNRYKEFLMIINNFDVKLNHIIMHLENQKNNTHEENSAGESSKKIKTLADRRVERRLNEDGKN